MSNAADLPAQVARGGRHVGVERAVFAEVTHDPAASQAVVGHVVPADERLPAAGSDETREDLHRRGLAGAVGSKERGNRSPGDGE